MTCSWAQDAPNILWWEMVPGARGDAAESRADTEPKQRVGGPVLQQGEVRISNRFACLFAPMQEG